MHGRTEEGSALKNQRLTLLGGVFSCMVERRDVQPQNSEVNPIRRVSHLHSRTDRGSASFSWGFLAVDLHSALSNE